MRKKEKQEASKTDFYTNVLSILHQHSIKFMLGGGFAMYHYTGITRDIKDLDIFCKVVQYPSILKILAAEGYQTEVTDVRWLVKVFKDSDYIDIIFDTVNNICSVDDTWYEHAVEGIYEGVPVAYLPVEELIWCKIYVQNRERYDGADVNHLLLKKGKQLDWKRLLFRIERHWQLLFAQLLLFQFVYPADHQEVIPRWVLDTLTEHLQEQYEIPPPIEKVCRGPVIDQTQYEVDIRVWNYKVSTIKTT